MSEKVSLKTQNMPFIILFLAWSISLYLLFFIGFNDFWGDLLSIFSKVNAEKGFLAVMAPLLAFTLSNVIDANKKAVLVFWKIKSPLPGCRAFTDIGPKDPRVDMNLLKDKLNVVPIEPAEQNRIWYRLYKEEEGKPAIDSSHKSFLLARDLTSISFLFLILTPWTIINITGNLRMTLIYAAICSLQYLILCKVAQNTGERFVGNVLAEYCCKAPFKDFS